MEGKDRRRNPRFEGTFRVDLLNMGDDPKVSPWEAVVSSEALDVSKHGMRLKSPYNVPHGSIISAVTYYKNHESVCLCEVVWKSQAGNQFLYGLFVKEWSRLDPSLKVVLDQMEADEKKSDGSAPASAPNCTSLQPA
jgi:hypothetical protein